ncbi:MAG TPA: hypothetical protein VJ901_07850 [Thermoanaerobaculia bacterium]|nr:hypothetical protein [Thermoanaerobaculia bacterium]
MRDLIRGGVVTNDPYIEQASRSIGLAVTRDTIRGWRLFRLRQNCPLTAAILGDRFPEVVDAIDCDSPFIEELSRAFLERAMDDELTACVARFELAMMSDGETIVDWPCDPYEVLAPLLRGERPDALERAPHRTLVSRTMAGRFRII